MMRALWTAASGMIAQQTNVDTISNNIANVNTTGYKSQRTEFKSLLYQTLQTKTTTANGANKPVGAQVGLGARVSATSTSFTQGELQTSDNDTDFAIEGEGFFAVQGGDGKTYYTRNGSFDWGVGVNGTTLTDTSGNPVLDTKGKEIVIPNGIASGSVQVASDGEVSYTKADGTTVSLNQKIGLFQFNNPSGLEKKADSLLAETAASGNAINESTATGITKSKVYQGYLEGSNVQVADEMVNLIVAQRAYELNSKAITASDEMLQQANNLRR